MEDHEGSSQSSQTNDFEKLCLSLLSKAFNINSLGHGMIRLVQCQDNVTERDITLWGWWPDLSVGQYCNVAMNVHSDKSEPNLTFSTAYIYL